MMRRMRSWSKPLGHQMYPTFDKLVFYPIQNIEAEGLLKYDKGGKALTRIDKIQIPAHTRMEATYSPRGKGGMWVFAFTLAGEDYHYNYSAEADLPCVFHEWRSDLEHGVKVAFVRDDAEEPNFPYRVHMVVGELNEFLWVVELNPDHYERAIFHAWELRILQDFEMDETQSYLVLNIAWGRKKKKMLPK